MSDKNALRLTEYLSSETYVHFVKCQKAICENEFLLKPTYSHLGKTIGLVFITS